jgi:hypothetical protein
MVIQQRFDGDRRRVERGPIGGIGIGIGIGKINCPVCLAYIGEVVCKVFLQNEEKSGARERVGRGGGGEREFRTSDIDEEEEAKREEEEGR